MGGSKLVKSWAAMETKRMMAIAAMPLPPGLFGGRP